MRGALVQVGHLNGVDGGHVAAYRGSGHASKRKVANLHGFDGFRLLTIQGAAQIHVDFDAAFGFLAYQTGKFLIRQRGGIAFGVNFTELENRFGNGHGRESKNHDKRKNQCENLFHLGTPPQIGLSLCGWDRDWNRSRKSLHTLYPWVSGLASLFWEKCYHTS